MEESYIKTGPELIEYWTRIGLSVAIKDSLHQQTFCGIWEQRKTKNWYQLNLISTNASDTQFMLTANIIP